VTSKAAIRPRSRHVYFGADDGSALPLFLFGFAFLISTAMVVATASGSLLQQRRLNGIADTLALAGANYSLQLLSKTSQKGAATLAPEPDASVGEFMTNLQDVLYPNSQITIAGLTAVDPGEVRLRICQPNNALFARLAAKSEVCANSAAKAIATPPSVR